jgi:hypothetical protein
MTPATSTSPLPALDPAPSARAELRAGLTVAGLALSARWLLSCLVLLGAGLAGGLETLGVSGWLALVSGRALAEAALAAAAAAGAFAITRHPLPGVLRSSDGALRLAVLSDASLTSLFALEMALFGAASPDLVALVALTHATSAFLLLRRFAVTCAVAGVLVSASWARAAGWTIVLATMLSLAGATPAAWVVLGLTVPVTSIALPPAFAAVLFVTLRARRAFA